jgi:hypothetical protein
MQAIWWPRCGHPVDSHGLLWMFTGKPYLPSCIGQKCHTEWTVRNSASPVWPVHPRSSFPRGRKPCSSRATENAGDGTVPHNRNGPGTPTTGPCDLAGDSAWPRASPLGCRCRAKNSTGPLSCHGPSGRTGAPCFYVRLASLARPEMPPGSSSGNSLSGSPAATHGLAPACTLVAPPIWRKRYCRVCRISSHLLLRSLRTLLS